MPIDTNGGWRPSDWYSFRLRNVVVVVPENDIHPHGTILGDGTYEFDDGGCPNCQCKPDLFFANNEGVYDVPMVVHHSFENKEILEKSLASNYPGLLD